MKTVLVVAGESDLHSKEVINYLNLKGVKSFLMDYSKFPGELSIGFQVGQKRNQVILRCFGETLRLEDIQSVLYRRPGVPQITNIQDSHLKGYVEQESQFFLDALSHIIPIPWISDPDAARVAMRKPYQFSVANSLGFRIPETIFGNSVTAVSQFIDSVETEIAAKAIHRAYVRTDEVMGPVGVFTQKLTKEEVQDRISRVQYCPLIFQEYIPKKFELRITVVGDQIFTCAIYSQENERTKIDWRNYDIPNTPHQAFELPGEVKKRCVALVHKLGLVFGCIDMVVTPENEYVFLEINPVGQWLWIEKLTGLPITEALANLLMK